jgi:hypothetical protein
MTLARRNGVGWRVASPVPVGEVATLFCRLRAMAGAGAVVLGADLPLGLPRGYAQRQTCHENFPAFLRALADSPTFFLVCQTLAEVSPSRPFYPARGLRGMTRAGHAAALGLGDASGLNRLCDHATTERPAGAPLFWTLGANQSGKAAIAAWRDLLLPAFAGPDPPLLWPFDGDLFDLIVPGRIVMAETYPAEALRHLGLRLPGSKRRQSDRATLAGGLRLALDHLDAVADPALLATLADGFGADAAGEDRFDSLLGLLCVLNVLNGHRPDGIPPDPWLRTWEGWVLGQTALPAGQRTAAVPRTTA